MQVGLGIKWLECDQTIDCMFYPIGRALRACSVCHSMQPDRTLDMLVHTREPGPNRSHRALRGQEGVSDSHLSPPGRAPQLCSGAYTW